jgi:hypothetical protein
MFAYCGNNPSNNFDDTGKSAVLITLGIMAIGGLGWLSNSGLFPTWLEWDPS